MKNLTWLVLLFGMLAARTGVAVARDDGILRITGSTTLLPVIAQSANEFMKKYRRWKQADGRLPEHRTRIFVSGGGSGFGVRSLINGTVHIGLASRHIKEKEKRLLGPHRAILVGRDIVVVAAHRNNPLARSRDGFFTAELARLFAGAITNYRQFDSRLPNIPIVLYVRDSGAGSAELFQKFILGFQPPATKALQVNSQGMLLNRLESNPRAIGYISSGLAFGSDKLKVFALDKVMPTPESAKEGAYKLKRPLIMIVKEGGSPLAAAFINYVLSRDGQQNFSTYNYLPAILEAASAGR